MELDEITKEAGQRLASYTSVALNLLQQLQQRREAAAREQQRDYQQLHHELTARLRATRAAHQAHWQRAAAAGYAPRDVDLVADWAAAAAWRDHDPAAAAALPAITNRLTTAGATPPSAQRTPEHPRPAPADPADRRAPEVTPQLREVAELITSLQYCSPSSVQRRLRLNYHATQRVLADLETLGVVGTPNSAHQRPVLLTAAQLDDVLTRAQREHAKDRHAESMLLAEASGERALAAQHRDQAAADNLDAATTAADAAEPDDPLAGAQAAIDAALAEAGLDAREIEQLRHDPDVVEATRLLAQSSHAGQDAASEQALAAGADARATTAEAAAGTVPVTGNVYAHGSPTARLAGEAYPEPAADAIGRSRRKAKPRKATPARRQQRDRGQGRTH